MKGGERKAKKNNFQLIKHLMGSLLVEQGKGKSRKDRHTKNQNNERKKETIMKVMADCFQ